MTVLKSLKRFIERQGRSQKIYSDNGLIFVAAAKWLRKVLEDGRSHDFNVSILILWQFNLRGAP